MEEPPESEFTVEDHTKLVAAVLERPLHVIKYLDLKAGRPTNLQIIDAALKVRAFDAEIKRLLVTVRGAGLRYEADRQSHSADFAARADRIVSMLNRDTVQDMMDELETAMADDSTDAEDVLAYGTALAILKHGEGTIYSPTYPPNEVLEGLSSPVLFEHVTGVGMDRTPTGAARVAYVDAATGAMMRGVHAAKVAGFYSVAAVISVIVDAFVGP